MITHTVRSKNYFKPTSGDLCIVTCHFNYANYNTPVRNFRRFLRLYRKYPIYGVELFMEGIPPITKDNPNWIHLKASSRHFCFQKEALLNICINNLPKNFTKVVVVDPDVYFENENWFNDVNEKLNEFDFVQPFSTCTWTGIRGEEILSKQSFFKDKNHVGHPGFAMAFRRESFNKIKFFPFCIVGGGDIIFAAAVSKQVDKIRHSLRTYYESHKFHLSEWLNNALSYDFNCSYIDGIIYHEYHGSKTDRAYKDRNEIIRNIDVNKLTLDANGLVELDKNLSNKIYSYFKSRNEDSVNINIANKSFVSVEKDVSVVVTSYSGYEQYLNKVIDSIDNQKVKFYKKIIVLDGYDAKVPSNWIKINANFRNPNLSRNAGLEYVNTEYVIFWDGDNFMPSNYLQSMKNVSIDNNTAIIYPNINYIEEDGRKIKSLTFKPYNYWSLRENNYIDTSSMWRTRVVKEVGGFNKEQCRFDDYDLALRITRLDYKAMHNKNAFTQITNHENRRSKVNDGIDALWNAYTFAIITAFGSSNCEDMIELYLNAELPPKSKIYWYCDFSNIELKEKLQNAAGSYSNISVIDSGITWKGNHHRDVSRHVHVANMYDKIISSIREDYVMFIEDDNFGPLNGIRQLFEGLKLLDPKNKAVCCGGKYRSRSNVICCCASSNSDRWVSVNYSTVKNKVINVGMIGGGFTLYANYALRKTLPIVCTNGKEGLVGWDGNIGKRLKGNKLYMLGYVEVEHRCKEVMEFIRNLEKQG